MTFRQKAAAFARRHKWKIIGGHVVAFALAFTIAVLVGAFAGAKLYAVYGQHLDKHGVAVYRGIAAKKVEKDQRAPTPVNAAGETLPAALAAKVVASNDQVAAGVTHPHPLATSQPSMGTSLVRNYSDRQAGARPVLLVAHDTESPNVPGTNDLKAIAAWFNNPVSQASSNYTTDADGNTLLMVPDTKKAWTQAFFNSWAISDEMIGYATETVWPDAQLRAVAQIFAAEAKRWGIPIQLGAVSGCTIVRPGIVDHVMLGACGGGHHDNGHYFPMTRFIGLVKAYAAGGFHPKPKPVVEPTPAQQLRSRTGYWSWLAWRLGQQAWKGYGHANPTVRPHVPRAIPDAWWRQAAIHLKGAQS